MKTLRDVLEIVDDKTNVELYIKGEKSFNEDGEEMRLEDENSRRILHL